MNDRELAKWLKDLAACYGYVPQKAAIERYLRILRQWKLSPAQWENLGDQAVMRLTRKFPMPGGLHEIVLEIKSQEQIRRDNDYMSRMREEWEHRLDAGKD